MTEGLTEREARERLSRDGPNLLSDASAKGLLGLLVELVTEPMIALLLVAVALYLVLGEVREAVLMAASVVAIIGLTLFTEWRTERAARALRELGSPRALVVRDGIAKRIAGAEVVVGDLVQIEEGDRVPADGELAPGGSGELLRIDESLLTGEAAPVTKDPTEAAARAVHAGTLVAAGRGRLVVTATGPRTRVGALGKRLGELEPEPSPLRRDIDRLVRIFAALGLLTSLALVAWLALHGTPITESLLAGIGLAIGMIPEEYPVILTVFLAIGAWRLSREHVLVRRLPAIEALGATTVLCVDKTGTLTENRMRVTAVWSGGALAPSLGTGAAQAVLRAGARASRRTTSEPMDLALSLAAEENGCAPEGEPIHDYPFGRRDDAEDEPLARMLARTAARAWRSEDGTVTLGLKGALEAVLALARRDPAQEPELIQGAAALAASGLRVLCVAEASQVGELPASRSELAWRVVGLVGIEDPVRAEVPAAVKACLDAGVRLLMITGDHPDTARAIAKAAGFARVELTTGAELDGLDDAAVSARLATVTVVARAHPEHKLRIVEALSARGDVVAMTGDGVNDALALKAAAIGIAMGERGTDVAREAASIVLTDDRFSSIVTGIRRGRRIFENLSRASGFVLMVHAVLAGLSLIPLAMGLPAALLPLHVVLLELVVDPSCSIVFEREPEPEDLLLRPPRDPSSSVLDRRTTIAALLSGCLALAACTGAYAWALASGASTESARAVAFLGVLVSLVSAIPLSRGASARRHDAQSLRALAILIGSVAASYALLIATPLARATLHWAAPPLAPALALTVVVPALVWLVYRLVPSSAGTPLRNEAP